MRTWELKEEKWIPTLSLLFPITAILTFLYLFVIGRANLDKPDPSINPLTICDSLSPPVQITPLHHYPYFSPSLQHFPLSHLTYTTSRLQNEMQNSLQLYGISNFLYTRMTPNQLLLSLLSKVQCSS